MIPVEPQPEPDDFDRLVRQPGQRGRAEGRLPPTWRRCLGDLHRAYDGICAYLCVYIPRGAGNRSVDHFIAKSSRPDLAYEWNNYRLATALMNSRKGAFDDVLDPFEIAEGWFVLELSFLKVLPRPELDEATRERVQATIDRLRLNDEECLEARSAYYDEYRGGAITFDFLGRKSPFLARELRRQGRV